VVALNAALSERLVERLFLPSSSGKLAERRPGDLALILDLHNGIREVGLPHHPGSPPQKVPPEGDGVGTPSSLILGQGV
jgi:hypothetical protein